MNNFNAGELSLLNAREDLAKFQNGCSIMENMIPLPQGGAQKRPGTKYIAEVKTSSLATRIIPFEFSTSQSYIIEVGNQYMRFFTDSAPVVTGDGTETLTMSNIVAHWLLNEISGTNVADDDGGTHDGTSSTDTSNLTVEGKVGIGAFDLDGQYDVVVSDSDDFSFTDDSNDDPFSISCWGYVTVTGNTQVLLSKWRDQTNTAEWKLSLTDVRKLELRLADVSATLESDRLAQWFLNDNAADTIVLDNVGVFSDGVSTTNTSTLSAADRNGAANGAFDLDNQYAVQITDNDGFSFDDSSSPSAAPFSISAWAFVTDTGATQTILSKRNTGAGNAEEWRLYFDTGEKLLFLLFDESTSALTYITSDGAITAGWHHIVVVYNNADASYTPATAANFMTFYIDGIVEASTAVNNAGYLGMENTAAPVHIGADASNGSDQNFFADKLDNITLYGKALTQADVSLLYNDGSGVETTTGVEISSITNNAIDEGWHHFVSTYSAPATEAVAADGIILYIDGTAVSSTATNSADYTAMQNKAEEIRIGSQRNSGDSANERFWNDKVDSIAVFSDVLTPTEVATLFNEMPYEIVTPYLTADLFQLKLEQSADVLYITHKDYETGKLSRLANALWTITPIAIQDGPFRTENSDVADFITASGTTGDVTLTATGHSPFVLGSITGHEPSGSTDTSKSQTGALFKLVHPLSELSFSDTLENDVGASSTEGVSWMSCGTLYKGAEWTWVTDGTWLGQVAVQRNYTIGAVFSDSGWETVLPFDGITTSRNVSTSGTEDDGDADYRVAFLDFTSGPVISYFTTDQIEHEGIVKITSVTNGTTALGTVVKTLASTNATYKWAEGSCSNYRGWFGTVTFFEDRLVFGGNTAQPDTIWGSVTSDYDSMNAGVEDDDAISFTLSSRQVNVIEWLVGKDKILIGTSGAEWTLEGGSDEPLTPTNVIAKQHSTYGSANIQSGLANESVLFFQRGKEKMREFAYNWELDSYVAPDMTILSSLITDGGINDMTFQKIPNSILWCVRNDGELPLFSYERNENVTAWARMVTQTNLAGTLTDSDFESVARISGSPEDEVWVVVERIIDSSTVRYIEQFQPRDFGDADDAFYVDAGITYDSGASSAMTGLDHLEGQAVYVLADGEVFDIEVVSGGAITLSLDDVTTTASTVQMGLGYEVNMRTMPLSVIGDVTIHGRQKRISEVITEWYKSGDFSIGKDVDNLGTYSISGQTTSIDRKTFSPGYSREGYVFIFQQSPEPLTVLAVMIEFNVN